METDSNSIINNANMSLRHSVLISALLAIGLGLVLLTADAEAVWAGPSSANLEGGSTGATAMASAHGTGLPSSEASLSVLVINTVLAAAQHIVSLRGTIDLSALHWGVR